MAAQSCTATCREGEPAFDPSHRPVFAAAAPFKRDPARAIALVTGAPVEVSASHLAEWRGVLRDQRICGQHRDALDHRLHDQHYLSLTPRHGKANLSCNSPVGGGVVAQ